ncbi:hypothetical protein [Micromonospora vulcania]|uniref:PASTA domain-containing protein n=1 Tax=Micromonospora vulcania TaxID=1441873 RepID=A0ABW1HAE4_9ACTN
MAKNKGAGTVLGAIAVVALALLLAPIVGAVWGLWVVATWVVRRGSEEGPSNGKAVGGAVVALASVAFGAAFYPAVFARQDGVSASTSSMAASPAPSRSPSVAPSTLVPPTVPYAVGNKPYAATELIGGVGLRSTVRDASPLDRHVLVEKNWLVVAMEPPAGTPVARGSEVTVLVLKNEEAAWFAAHPKMPRLPKGMPAGSLSSNNGVLAGMSELVLYRYAKGQAPKSATEPNDKYTIDGWEPAEETRARAGLKMAYESGSVVVDGIPAAGQVLRPGRLIVVTVKDAPKISGQGNSGGRLPSVPRNNDGDDDVNVPGWLCPTRFC